MPSERAEEGAAEMVDRISDRLMREAEIMDDQCTHPPCLHAQGIRLAESYVRNEWCHWMNERVPDAAE